MENYYLRNNLTKKVYFVFYHHNKVLHLIEKGLRGDDAIFYQITWEDYIADDTWEIIGIPQTTFLKCCADMDLDAKVAISSPDFIEYEDEDGYPQEVEDPEREEESDYHVDIDGKTRGFMASNQQEEYEGWLRLLDFYELEL